MKKLLLGQYALADLEQIITFLRQENPNVALRFVKEFKRISRLLWEMPEMGTKVSFITKRQYLMFPIGKFHSYLIFYVIKQGKPVIIRIIHGKQDIEALFEQDDDYN